MSQGDFATQLGVHKNTIGQYERGKRQPDAELLGRLHRAFAININWLLTGEGPMRIDQAPGPAAEQDAEAELARIEKLLEDEQVPIGPERLRQRPDLEEARQALLSIAQDVGAPQRARIKADRLLAAAFDDNAAWRRENERLDDVGDRLRQARQRVNQALEDVKWRPDRATTEFLAILTFRYNIHVADLIGLIRVIRPENPDT